MLRPLDMNVIFAEAEIVSIPLRRYKPAQLDSLESKHRVEYLEIQRHDPQSSVVTNT